MEEKKKIRDGSINITTGDIKIVLPNIDTKSKDEEANEYIDKLLENAKESMTEANSENENVKEDEIKNDSETIADESITEVVDTQRTDSENKSKKRKLLKYEKIILGILVILPLIQLVSICALKALPAIVIGVILFILIGVVSYSCRQYSMLFVSAALLAIPVFILFQALPHGLVAKDLQSKSIMRINYLNQNTPTKVEGYDGMSDDELTEAIRGKFVYYYKYGCKDCAVVDAQVQALLDTQGYDYICVETRSDLGKQLLKLYPVSEVPAGLVVFDNTYNAMPLYTVENGETVFDMDAITDLFAKLDTNESTD